MFTYIKQYNMLVKTVFFISFFKTFDLWHDFLCNIWLLPLIIIIFAQRIHLLAYIYQALKYLKTNAKQLKMLVLQDFCLLVSLLLHFVSRIGVTVHVITFCNWFTEILRSLSPHSGCVVLFSDLQLGEISCPDLIRRKQCILIAVNEQNSNSNSNEQGTCTSAVLARLRQGHLKK